MKNPVKQFLMKKENLFLEVETTEFRAALNACSGARPFMSQCDSHKPLIRVSQDCSSVEILYRICTLLDDLEYEDSDAFIGAYLYCLSKTDLLAAFVGSHMVCEVPLSWGRMIGGYLVEHYGLEETP